MEQIKDQATEQTTETKRQTLSELFDIAKKLPEKQRELNGVSKIPD